MTTELPKHFNDTSEITIFKVLYEMSKVLQPNTRNELIEKREKKIALKELVKKKIEVLIQHELNNEKKRLKAN